MNSYIDFGQSVRNCSTGLEFILFKVKEELSLLSNKKIQEDKIVMFMSYAPESLRRFFRLQNIRFRIEVPTIAVLQQLLQNR